MTKTTDTRQLRLTIGAALRANGIEALKVEADVCSAVTRFYDEVRKGTDPVKARERISAAYFAGIVESQPKEKMKQRIMSALHINISENPEWDRVVEFCIERDAEGQTVEKFATACAENPFQMPKAFQIAEKPQTLINNWPQAFTVVGKNAKDERRIPTLVRE